MARYSREFKDGIMVKLLEAQRLNYGALSEEIGIHDNTLRRWKQAAGSHRNKASGTFYNKQTYSSEED